MSEATKKIIEEYENMRSQRESERRARVAEIYGNFPEIEAIDREIYRIGAENVKNIISSLEKADELNREYKKRL